MTALTVNGQDRSSSAATVAELLSELEIDQTGRGLAVARNGAVVPRADWAETPLALGDRIEIVRPFQGG